MEKSTTEHQHSDLVNSLIEDLEPVTPLQAPLKAATFTYLSILVYSCVTLTLMGPLRPGWSVDLKDLRFLTELTLGLTAGAAVCLLVFKISIPGEMRSKRQMFFYLLPLAAWVILISYSLLYPALPVTWEGWRFGCEREIALVALIPVVFLWKILRSRPLQNRRWTAFLTGVTAALPAAATLHVACMYHPAHILLYHVLPALLVGWITSLTISTN